jgi:hypothetical protein
MPDLQRRRFGVVAMRGKWPRSTLVAPLVRLLLDPSRIQPRRQILPRLGLGPEVLARRAVGGCVIS